jgi:large subunit ribosomal protein L3
MLGFFVAMKFILGKKIGMSQMFAPNGDVVPVTFIHVGPIVVLQKREKEKDGYQAIQFGYGARKAKRIAKAQKGHFGELGNMVNTSGVSKAKGFQGVVKRHGFRGAPATHGTKHALREPGSIGGAGLRSHVIKGMRMAGRMGGERITIEGLKIIKVDPERNVLVVKGAVPGVRGGLLEIRGE